MQLMKHIMYYCRSVIDFGIICFLFEINYNVDVLLTINMHFPHETYFGTKVDLINYTACGKANIKNNLRNANRSWY